MRRILGASIVVALLTISGIALSQSLSGPEIIPLDYECDGPFDVSDRQAYFCLSPQETSTTSSSSSTTSSTTTSEPSTTTTTAPTTTTTTITTTTTQPPTGLVIPPTEPYPTNGLRDDGGYDIIASNADTGVTWWTAPYWGAGGLSMYPGQGAWIDGDRQGYSCGYGFVVDSDDEITGRFAFVRPPNQAYGKVNDRYMAEGVRYLDGSLRGPQEEGNELSENCSNVLSDIDYAGACRDVDERPRVGFFDGDGNILDIRDYTRTVANSGINFNLHSFDGTRATVIACEDGLVGMIVYYDSMGDGQLAVDFNGTGPFG